MGGDFGYAINRRSELRIGEDLLWFHTVKKVADDPLPNISQRQAVSNLHYRYYGVDNPEIPRTGFNIDATFNWFQIAQNFKAFPEAEIRTSFFIPVSRPGSVFFTANGGTAFGTNAADVAYQFFTLGGPLRLGAFGLNQLVGSQYYLFQAGYERKLLSFSPLIGEGLYALAVLEAGKVGGVQPGVPALPLDGSFCSRSAHRHRPHVCWRQLWHRRLPKMVVRCRTDLLGAPPSPRSFLRSTQIEAVVSAPVLKRSHTFFP